MFIKYVEFLSNVLIGDTAQLEVHEDEVDYLFTDERGVWAELEGYRTLIPWNNVRYAIYKIGK